MDYTFLHYFQINLGIYVQDSSMELSILVDRSVGGTSLVDGQIELMLHRFVISLAAFYDNRLLYFCSVIIHFSCIIRISCFVMISDVLLCFIGGCFMMMQEVLVRH